jgi:hypothetical protein
LGKEFLVLGGHSLYAEHKRCVAHGVDAQLVPAAPFQPKEPMDSSCSEAAVSTSTRMVSP